MNLNEPPLQPDKKLMAVKVLPHVYLGDARASLNDRFFNRAGIGAVLNMTANIPNTFKDKDSVEYLRIPVHDSAQKRDVGKMYQYLPVVTEYIYKTTVIEGKNILVHCALGRQRSCAAIAAYLIKFYKMTPIEAMDYIISKKPDSFHWGRSVNFAKSLNRWYYKLNPDEEVLEQ